MISMRLYQNDSFFFRTNHYDLLYDINYYDLLWNDSLWKWLTCMTHRVIKQKRKHWTIIDNCFVDYRCVYLKRKQRFQVITLSTSWSRFLKLKLTVFFWTFRFTLCSDPNLNSKLKNFFVYVVFVILDTQGYHRWVLLPHF